MLKLSDFDFELPPELIAQAPAAQRSGSRLLDVAPDGLADRRFADLPSLLREGDLAVFNDTRVIRARVHGRKPTGGRVEMLVERVLAEDSARVQMRASHLPRPGGSVDLPGGARAEVLARDERFFDLRFHDTGPLVEWLERHGEVPLPPYIAHAAGAEDAERYQTVYAAVPGAVAAPTAGLHFDAATLAALDARGVARATVTLHVGAGTFQPVQSENLSLHRMHAEWFRVPPATAQAVAAARARGGRVLAVGTTSLRALESSAGEDGSVRAGEAETTLFVTPGYRFRVADLLLTNFHLPRSTLLMLVAAFAGYARIRAAYAHAIARRYRFFSYGDAMLLRRAEAGA
ncbi:MAG: tRNA preQ1(34) S-adenosylmethionine ribosyltransferase-isomerase QueA [Betaproteobacteria bacterium]|nr:tRNA preQ1(34) S-adenosylmethionine ribosyltransferase-isomerase QueA [Betaproteobacteria bacterium]MDH5285464.1 tRNA preQ1(34) S-adenosylmethionine ribosyltransferase-isomerase QueA [Betaproteobacteria bacterium]